MVTGVRSAIARAHATVRQVATQARAEEAAQYAATLDSRRSDLLGAGAKLLLVKGNAVTETITTGWGPSPPVQLGSDLLTSFEVARAGAEFNEKVAEASHFVVTDSTDLALNNRLFEINRDTTEPTGVKRGWRLRGLQSGRRFFPPPEEP